MHRLRRIGSVARRAAARVRRAPEHVKRWIDRQGGPAPRKTHILITGFPRSGTSLFYNMLSSTLSGFEFDRAEIPATQTIWRYDNRVSKRPFDLFEIEDILEANIHGKRLVVIASIRDVRDIATSIYPKAPDVYLIGYEGCYQIEGDFPDYRRRFTGPGIRDFHRELVRWRESGAVEIFELRYEDLVCDPHAVQERLREQLDLRFHGALEDHHRHRERHAIRFEGKSAALAPELVKFHDPVSPSYVGRWAETRHRARIQEQFTQHPELFSILRSYGYEKDDSWFEAFSRAPA